MPQVPLDDRAGAIRFVIHRKGRGFMSTEATLKNLVDRDAVREVVQTVCRAMDRADYELFLSAYHRDAWDDHGYFKGPISEFKPGSIFRGAHVKSLLHHITTHLITVDGDVAFSEAYYIAVQRAEQDGKLFDTTFCGRYHDRLERRAGQWKIADRLTIFDSTRVDEVTATLEFPGAVSGQANKDDPTYQRAAKL